MRFWLDVETPAGVVVGDGPITTARNWQHVPRLDAAGEVSFEMPASDPHAAYLVNKRIVRCKAIIAGAVSELGAGIIEGVERAPGRPTMLRVTGFDLLSELSRRSVRRLAVCEQQWVSLTGGRGRVVQLEPIDPYPAYESTDLPEAYDGDGGTAAGAYLASYSDPGLPENATWLYVGYDARFDRAEFTFSAGNSRASALEAQYFDGTGWVFLDITDGTSVGGRTFAQSGVVTWPRPDPWDRYTALEGGNWFWVRFRAAYDGGQVTTDTVQVAEVRVYADVPTTAGVDQIMALAPSDWTRGGYPATGRAAYIQFDGESVLAALIALAEQTGEHFRLASSGRAIEWLDDFEDSGLRAVAATDPVAQEGEDGVVLITDLVQRLDTATAISRIIPIGADGLTLAHTTRSAPDGYTLNAASGYLERDSAISAWGVIEEQVYYPEIGVQQADSATEHPAMAADALFDKAYEDLRKRSAIEEFYGLTVTKVAGVLRPGQTIRVVYHEWVDGYHVVNVDADLDIMATAIQVDETGQHTVGLEVATIDRPPTSDERTLAQSIRDLKSLLRAPGGMRNPLLNAGDLAVGWIDGAPMRIPVGGAGQVLTVSGGMPTWATPRKAAVYVQAGAVAVDAAIVPILRVPAGMRLTVKEWHAVLTASGSDDTVVELYQNGSEIGAVTLGPGATHAETVLSVTLAAGDVLGAMVTAIGPGAVGLNCTAVCEG